MEDPKFVEELEVVRVRQQSAGNLAVPQCRCLTVRNFPRLSLLLLFDLAGKILSFFVDDAQYATGFRRDRSFVLTGDRDLVLRLLGCWGPQ